MDGVACVISLCLQMVNVAKQRYLVRMVFHGLSDHRSPFDVCA